MALNVAKFSNSFGRVKRQPQIWWSAEKEEAVSERRKAFTAARQAYIFAFQHTSSVIAKAKAEAWFFRKALLVQCHRSRQSCLSYAKALSSF